MKIFLLCLCLMSAASWADQTDTYRLNELINKAVRERDFEKARRLAVTKDQFDYVEKSIAFDKQTKDQARSERTKREQRCFAVDSQVTCY